MCVCGGDLLTYSCPHPLGTCLVPSVSIHCLKRGDVVISEGRPSPGTCLVVSRSPGKSDKVDRRQAPQPDSCLQWQCYGGGGGDVRTESHCSRRTVFSFRLLLGTRIHPSVALFPESCNHI